MRSKLLVHFMKGRISFSPSGDDNYSARELENCGGFGQAGMRDSNKASRSASCGEI
jgi:hypothetical protein